MGERVAVIGFGVTGQSIVRHLRRVEEPTEIVVLDTRSPIDDLPVEMADADIRWQSKGMPREHFDRIIVSPGLSMDSCLMQGALTSGLPILSDIDLFFAHARAPVIGITGTNGKSTVTSLVGHMLQGAGYKTGVGGNLGEAALDLLDDEVDCYVLELSSFQLERSKEHSFQAAVVLNISDDHIDQHGSFANYKDAKHRIFANAKKRVFNRDDPHTGNDEAGSVSFGSSEPRTAQEWGLTQRDGKSWIAVGGQLVAAVDALPLDGAHNVLNAMAACALVDGTIPCDQMAEAIEGFAGLEHRFESVGFVHDVQYVNDSKATNVGATVAALAGLPSSQGVVLIAGGDAKGADLSVLKPAFQSSVKALIALGVDRDKIMDVAEEAGVSACAVETIEEAVVQASSLAAAGDMVLLSPACASLDMFRNYAERGRRFRQAVEEMS